MLICTYDTCISSSLSLLVVPSQVLLTSNVVSNCLIEYDREVYLERGWDCRETGENEGGGLMCTDPNIIELFKLMYSIFPRKF